MVKVPCVAESVTVTKGGNWLYKGPSRIWKAAGRPKPKTISRGNGLGGRRPPPSIKKILAASGQQREIRDLARGKT
jgi:hypothetical protein